MHCSSVPSVTLSSRRDARDWSYRYRCLAVIDRQSEINPSVATGTTLASQAAGKLELRQVRFAYPARPAVPVLHDFSLRAAAGKVTALVGASGSGKSTVVGLVERFYDVASGAIYFDGVDVRQLSLPWLRRQVRGCRRCISLRVLHDLRCVHVVSTGHHCTRSSV